MKISLWCTYNNINKNEEWEEKNKQKNYLNKKNIGKSL